MIFGFFGCASPEQEDFVGVWIGDSVKLELKSDGSCIATGNNAYLLLGEDTKPSDSNQRMQGSWEFKYRLSWRNSIFESKRIEISLKDNDTQLQSTNIIHYIKSLTNKSYTLYFDLSDPDEMDRFELRKQKAENNADEPVE